MEATSERREAIQLLRSRMGLIRSPRGLGRIKEPGWMGFFYCCYSVWEGRLTSSSVSIWGRQGDEGDEGKDGGGEKEQKVK